MENTHTTFEVTASNRKEAQQIFVMMLILLALYADKPVSCVPVDETILKIPAFGRIAQLGSIYDARTSSLIGVNILKSNLPTTLTTIQTPGITRESQIIKNESDKFNLFRVDLDTAASIQTGIIQPEGAASFLSDDITSSGGVTGLFLQTFRTAEETLPIFHDELQNYFNTDARLFQGATHVVTGISLGGSIAVKFIDTLSSKRSSVRSINILKEEFKKLRRTSVNIGTRQPSSFEMHLTSDVSLQNALPTTLREVRGQINHVQESIKIINSGLGVPLKFTLTPISILKNYLNVTTVTESTLHKLEEKNLDSYLNILDDNKFTKDALINFEDNSNCVSNELHQEIEKLHKSFYTAEQNFKIECKNILLGVKSGAFNNSALSEVLQNYISQDCNPKDVSAILSLHEQAQQKVNFCSQLNEEYPDIEYFGSAANLISKIYQNHNKPTYVLFTKSEFKESDRVSYEDNLNIFLNFLYKPSNALFIVDCDFSYAQCESINGTVIKQIRQGSYTFNDVRLEIKITEMESKTKIVECNKEFGFTGALCVSTMERTSTKSKIETLNGNSKKPGGSRRSINVVGGNTANPHEFPFQILILRNSTGVHCGGSILNENFILTAAHCFYDYDDEYESWTIVAGDHNWQIEEETEQRRKIRKVHIHRNYIPIAQVNDIAILQLDRPLQLSTKVQPILLPDADYEASGNAVLTGWGRLQSGGTNPLVLQKVTVPIVDRADCVEAYEEDQIFVSVKMLCAGHLGVGGVDACQGDSGGPLSVQLSNGSSMIVGVVSGGIGCARPEYPGIYMRVSKYVHWINDALNNFGCSGIIDLPEPGKFALFEYKSTETYSNNEQCVWTLRNLAAGNRQWSNLKVTLMDDGLQSCCDKVSFLSLSRYVDLISKPLSSMVPEESGAEWHFLSFLSDSSVTGTGFIIRIDVISVDAFGFASLIVPFATSQGSYTKLATDRYYQALIVVTPGNRESTFSVDSTDIEVTDGCFANNLQVYEISLNSNFARRAKLCGKTSSPASFRTTFPVIALLGETRLTSSFKVSWT